MLDLMATAKIGVDMQQLPWPTDSPPPCNARTKCPRPPGFARARAHTWAISKKKFKTIEICHSQIRKTHADPECGISLVLHSTVRVIVFSLKTEDCSDIERLQLPEIVFGQRCRSEEQVGKHAGAIHEGRGYS